MKVKMLFLLVALMVSACQAKNAPPVISTMEPTRVDRPKLTCDELSADPEERVQQLMAQGGECISVEKPGTKHNQIQDLPTPLADTVIVTEQTLNSYSFGASFKAIALDDVAKYRGSLFSYISYRDVNGEKIYTVGVTNGKYLDQILLNEEVVNLFVVVGGDEISAKNTMLAVCKDQGTCVAGL